MTLKNTPNSYGSLTKILHLLVAALFVVQFVLVYWRDYVPKSEPLNLQLILLHKSIGFTLLFIGLFFILWCFLNTKPQYPASMARWETILATATRHSLYLVILLMPLTGTLMSFLGGRGLKWFGYDIPNLFTLNEPAAGLLYNGHVMISYVVIGLVVLHITGALKHYFVDNNGILERMMRK